MNIPGLQALARDRFFHLLFIIGAVLSIFVPFAPHTWPAVIDWRTIITLSGLMMLTKGVELSGYFDVLGRKMVRRFATERRLALFMVFICCGAVDVSDQRRGAVYHRATHAHVA